MDSEQSLYEVLEVSETATDSEIKRAYRRLSKERHSDITGGGREADQRFIRLKDAYEQLSDSQRRAKYDKELREKRHEAGRSAASVDRNPDTEADAGPPDYGAEEPLLPALGELLWRLIRAGVRSLPWVFRTAPRIVVVGALLIVGVVLGSWALRSYSQYTDEQNFGQRLPDELASSCEGRATRFIVDGHLPEGSSAALDCNVRGVLVTYFDTDEGVADRYFARHLRRARSRATIRRSKPGSCARPGHVTTYWYPDGYGVSGRVFCWVDQNGLVRFEWTDNDMYAQAVARRRYGLMYRWWLRSAGPYGISLDPSVPDKVR